VSKTNYPYAESLSYDIEADEETTYEKISIIGIGSAGSNIVDQMAGYLREVLFSRLNSEIETEVGMSPLVQNTPLGIRIQEDSSAYIDINFLAINSEKSHLRTKRNLSNNSKIAVGEWGSGGDVDRVGRWYRSRARDVESVIENSTFVIVITGFGGGTGTGIFPHIMDSVDKVAHDAPVMPIVIIPAESEGTRRKRAIQYIQKYYRSTDHPIVLVDNEKLFKDPRVAYKKVTEGFREVNHKIVDAVSALLLSKFSVGIINVDNEDLKNAFSKRESFATLLHWEIPDTYSTTLNGDNVMEAVRKLLQSPFADVDVRYSSIFYVFFLAYRGVTMGFYTNFQKALSSLFGEYAEIKYDYIEIANNYGSPLHKAFMANITHREISKMMTRDRIVGIASGIPEDSILLFKEDSKKTSKEEELLTDGFDEEGFDSEIIRKLSEF